MPRRRARRGDGSVSYIKSEHSWVAVFPTREYRNGRAVRKKLRAATRLEAEHNLEILRATYGRGQDVLTMTMSEYLDQWFASYRTSIRPSTAVSYKGHIDNHIKPVVGTVLVGRLTPEDVRRVITRASRTHKPATVHRIVNTLSCALQTAKDDRVLPDNVASGVRLPRVQSAPVKAMTAAERDLIIEAVKGTDYDAIVRLLLGSGMRLGEACGLDWGDVHLDDRFVVVRRSKTKPRAVPINDDAVAALKALTRTGDSKPVFLGPRTGRRLSEQTVSHGFPKLLTDKGLPRMRVHDLRHGVATMMLTAGAPMRVIQEQLGHSSMTLTAKTYVHVVPELQRRAIDSLGGAK